MTAATAAATVSQELSPFGLALGVSRAGTKYPVRGIPHFDQGRRDRASDFQEKLQRLQCRDPTVGSFTGHTEELFRRVQNGELHSG